MKKDVAIRDSKDLFHVSNFAQAMEMAKAFADSDFCPKDYKGRPENVLIAMQLALDVGLPAYQGPQTIAVIGGRPTLWGDGFKAVAMGHPDCEYIVEKEIIRDGKFYGYSCEAKRKEYPPHTATFTLDDAKTANLLGKSGPWTQYPKRMCQMRARGFCLRDVFADALKGIQMREEIEDISAKRVNNVVNRISELVEEANPALSQLKEDPIFIADTKDETLVLEDIFRPGERIEIEKHAKGLINDSFNMETLKSVFMLLWESYPDHRKFIAQEKDRRKSELMKPEADQFNKEWDDAK